MQRLFSLLLLALLLCTCGRDPLSIEEVSISSGAIGSEMTRIELDSAGPITKQKELLDSHEDLTIKMSYRLPPGGGGELLLLGTIGLDLATLNLDNHQPLLPTSFPDDIYQDLEIIFVAGIAERRPLISEVYLNGNLVHDRVIAGEAGELTGPLTIVPSGKGVEMASLLVTPTAGVGSRIDEGGEVELRIPLFSYETYALPEGSNSFSKWESAQPDTSGYIKRFALSMANPGTPSYATRFTGTLNIPKGGKYKWDVFAPATVNLMINGEVIFAKSSDEGSNEFAFVDLAAGDHAFTLDYIFPGGWDRIDIGYEYEDEPRKYLNTMEQAKDIATPSTGKAMIVESDDRPYILRSFLYFPPPKMFEESEKLTHVVSVGEGEGPHYSIDLQTGALLQVWKGRFADAAGMWDGRGSGQAASPLGLALSFDGAIQWADDAETAWPNRPEEPDEDDFVHRVYELDESGRPTFIYTLPDAEVTDHLEPSGGGLVRELTCSGAGVNLYTVVASADKITETSPGNYSLRGPGMNLSIESYDGDGLFRQTDEHGRERLIAQLSGAGHLTYRMDW